MVGQLSTRNSRDLQVMLDYCEIKPHLRDRFENVVISAAEQLHQLYRQTFRLREFNHCSVKNILLVAGFEYTIEYGRVKLEHSYLSSYQKVIPSILKRNGWNCLGARVIYGLKINGKRVAVRPYVPEQDLQVNYRKMSRRGMMHV